MKSICLTAAMLALVVLGVDKTTGAYWTAGDAIPGTELQTGRLDLKVEGLDAVSNYAALDVAGLLPGMSKASILTISNAGDVPLDYTVAVTGANAGAKNLLAELTTTVTDADTTAGITCEGTPVTGSVTLAPGASKKVCVEVLLPLAAPDSVAGAAVDLTIDVKSTVRNAWTDEANVTGTHLATVALTAPTVSCAPAGLGVKLSWPAVPGAIDYQVRSGPVGDLVNTLTGGALSAVLTGTGIATVEAVFPGDWVSEESPAQPYVLGACT